MPADLGEYVYRADGTWERVGRCYWCGIRAVPSDPVDTLTWPGVIQKGTPVRLAHRACAIRHGWVVQQQWFRNGTTSASRITGSRTLLPALRPFLRDAGSGTRWRVASREYGPSTIRVTLEPYTVHRGQRLRLLFLGDRTLVLHRVRS